MIEYDDLDFSKMNTNELLETIHNIRTERDSYLLQAINQANEEFLKYGFVKYITIFKALYIINITFENPWSFLLSAIDNYNGKIENVPRLIVHAYTLARIPIEYRDRVKATIEQYKRKHFYYSPIQSLRYIFMPKYVTIYRGGRADEAALNDGMFWWSWTLRKGVACRFAYKTREHVGRGVVYRVRIRKDRFRMVISNMVCEVLVTDLSEKDKVEIIKEVETPHYLKDETKIGFCFLLIETYLRLWIDYLLIHPIKTFFRT